MKRVVVTGVGLVTPLGVGRERTWSRLLAGENGLGRIRGFDASRLPSRVAAEVPKVDERGVREERGLAEDELFHAGEVLGTTLEEARKQPGKHLLMPTGSLERRKNAKALESQLEWV
mmetsp:Transcript_14947/g.22004  ORF Transcript_14947/g.22004 Transcript_14947/m.22004 type:complete len:117 (-) Transcript_14947:1530-1880(-)